MSYMYRSGTRRVLCIQYLLGVVYYALVPRAPRALEFVIESMDLAHAGCPAKRQE